MYTLVYRQSSKQSNKKNLPGNPAHFTVKIEGNQAKFSMILRLLESLYITHFTPKRASAPEKGVISASF